MPADLVFPPVYPMDTIKDRMPQRQLVLAYFNTSRGTVAFLFTNDKYVAWQVDQPGKIISATKDLLKAMGHFDGNAVITSEQLADDSWKRPAAELLPLLIKNAKPDFWDDYDELVIVPDGPLWYVPFEALQVPTVDETTVSLGSKIPIRYAPTVSLALDDGRGRAVGGKTAIVTGQLFPRDDERFALEASEEIRGVLPDAQNLSGPLPATSALQKSVWQQLIVLDDVDDRTTAGYLWSPAQIDRGKSGSRLADWLALPWGGPETVILPGFQTAAEPSLKTDTTGDEIFLSLCGLMSTGTQTVLISRWRTGGQTSVDLVREFMQELPGTTAAQAWRRSTLLARAAEIDPEREPRIKLSASADLIRADHPFFWSGYILADTGTGPARDADAK